ncbi:hypothetical protein ACFV9W_37825 [Streptomyces sp. NPDC059897]|uniref:hypothetical protein n=1 Tax=Streptomyces sp. NPDC059897 TaxID=3346994 RepID=UPI00364EDBAF
MQTSRIARTTLASAVLGLGAVTAVAATAEAAPRSTQPAATATVSAAQHGKADRTQTLPLSDGSTAHVTKLANGTYQAWVTKHGVRIAALDSAHKTQRVHGYTYVLNQANGFAGVEHPGGWHSEQDVPQHSKKDAHHKKQDHKKKHHKNQSCKTHDVRLADGAVAHVTKLPNGTYQAWVTKNGVRIAALDAHHSTARVHGHHYTLNTHTGAVHVR